MTCTRVGNAIVCTNPWGRLHVGNKYIMVDFHSWCGPSFYTDRAMNNLYDPVDENDPIWEVFAKWYNTKYFVKNKVQKSGTRTETVLL